MQPLLLILLLQSAFAFPHYLRQSTIAQRFRSFEFNDDYSFIGSQATLPPRTYNFINGTFE